MSLVPKTLEIIFISDYHQARGLLLQMLSMNVLTHIMLNKETHFTFIPDNTINEIVQTNSHRFDTHVLKTFVVVCFSGNHYYYQPLCN